MMKSIKIVYYEIYSLWSLEQLAVISDIVW